MGEIELFPVACGVLVGLYLGLLRPSRRWRVGAPLALVGGVLATVVSGEYEISWAFLAIDIPLVAGFAAVALAGAHYLRWLALPKWVAKSAA